MLKLFGAIKNYWLIGMTAITGVLALYGKYQKSKREIAEKEAAQEKANRLQLERDKQIIEEIDEAREIKQEEIQKEAIENKVKLEALKYEEDNAVVVDSITKLLNKNNNPNRVD